LLFMIFRLTYIYLWMQALMLLVPIFLAAQVPPPQNAPRAKETLIFERLTIEQGLSQGRIISILQDKRGFMWFGTEDGLNRYDGIEIRTFASSNDARSLPSNYIEALYEDKQGTLWVGTKSGLAKFDRVTETFTRYRTTLSDPTTLPNNYVTSIVDDATGAYLWVGTYGRGLARLDKSSQKFTSFRKNTSRSDALQSDIVWRVAADTSGTLWVGSYEGGLYRYNSQTNAFTRFSQDTAKQSAWNRADVQALCTDHNGMVWAGTNQGLWKFEYRPVSRSGDFTRYTSDPANPATLRSPIVQAVMEDRQGRMWVGTKNGLHLFDHATEQFTVFQNDPADPNTLVDNEVLSLYEDRSGTIWAGTANGVSFFNPNARKFVTYRAIPNLPTSLSSNVVWAFTQDKQGHIWIGTETGLNRLESKPLSGVGAFRSFRKNDNVPNQLHDDFISALCAARDGSLWIGTNEGGLHLMRRTEVSNLSDFTAFLSNPEDATSLSSNTISAIIEDKRGKIWIATREGVNRLERIDASGKAVFTRFASIPSKTETSLISPYVLTLVEDKQGFIWAGTENGITRINATSGEMKSFRVVDADTGNMTGISADDNAIQQICESKNGTLWIGTQGGLYKFDRASEKFSKVIVPNNIGYNSARRQVLRTILGITEDNAGNLWLSTNEGLCRYTPATNGFRFYDTRDGLQSKEFVTGAVLRDKQGNIYFGGVNGFNMFHPDSMQRSSTPPPLVITSFTRYGEAVPLDTAIAEKRQIRLRYDENTFEIGFAALSYSFVSRNRYRYKLEGFEEEWHYAEASNDARYTNVEPGMYTFHVQACNYDEIWNDEGATLTVDIPPPFWATWWFRGLIFLVIGGIAIITVLNQRGRGNAATASLATLIVLLISEILDDAVIENLTERVFSGNGGLEAIAGLMLKLTIIIFALLPLEKRLHRFFLGRKVSSGKESVS
jgi:ligand-binding sensor domain-containing protein